MFVTNYNMLPKNRILSVNKEEKQYLESIGFIPLSFFEDTWIFNKTDELLESLEKLKEGGING